MAESQGCSVVVVVMVTGLAFFLGAGAGAAGLWFGMPYIEDSSGTTAVAEVPSTECPPCEAAVAAGSASDYALVYPIEESLRVQGKLDPELVKNQVKAKRYEFSKCYREAIEKDPSVKGEMSVQFTVSGSKGNIIAAVERDTAINASIKECVLTEVKKWKFEPATGSNSVVRFDMLFVPISSAPAP